MSENSENGPSLHIKTSFWQTDSPQLKDIQFTATKY